jgi:transposase
MRYELTEYEWVAIRPFLPNKPRGVPRVDDRSCPRIATSYDRLTANYLAFIKLASIRIWLRAYESAPKKTWLRLPG